MNYLWLVVSGILALLRICGVKAEWFQAASHLLVGGFFGVAIAWRQFFPYGLYGTGLTVIETLCFAWPFIDKFLEQRIVEDEIKDSN